MVSFRSGHDDEFAADPRRWGYATGSEVAARLSSSIADYELPLAHHGAATGAAYSHNTYHGLARHQRAPLIMDGAKPLRFTDSAPGHLHPTPGLSGCRQRRRSSNASNDSEVIAPFY